ncbi:hypothetical protein WDU94_014614 [Cyamophila willieti]
MVAISDVLSKESVYFKEAVDFFEQFSWIFDFPNTDILVKDVLSQISPAWSSVFSSMTDDEIDQYPVQLFTKSTWPLDLQNFTKKCKQYQLCIEQYSGAAPVKLPGALQRGVGKKKMHEISILSSLINEKCNEKNIKCLVDIGSGVGYLDEILVYHYDFNVIGLECDQSKIDGALTRIEKQNTKNKVEYKGKLKYICTYITHKSISCERNPLIENAIVHISAPNNVPKDCSAIVYNKTNKKKHETNGINEKQASFQSLDNNERNISDVTNKETKDQNMFFNSVDANENISQFDNSDNEKTQVNSIVSKHDTSSIALHNDPYCFIGLHTCGDLSISVIQHFFSLPLAQQLIYIPCCYHKLKCLETVDNFPQDRLSPIVNQSTINFTSTNESGANFPPHNIKRGISSSLGKVSFANFPLSRSLRICYQGKDFLSVPFLRLAAQETAQAWCHYSKEQKDEKVYQLLFRSVLQLYAARENVKLLKKGRRPVKINHISSQDTHTLINASVDSFDLKCVKTGTRVDWKPSVLTQLWADNVSKVPLVRTLLILQNSLQGSAESLILLDRFKFLLEAGLTRVELLQIFDERISPRRYCFVVSK